jgi:hypothetical protein
VRLERCEKVRQIREIQASERVKNRPFREPEVIESWPLTARTVHQRCGCGVEQFCSRGLCFQTSVSTLHWIFNVNFHSCASKAHQTDLRKAPLDAWDLTPYQHPWHHEPSTQNDPLYSVCRTSICSVQTAACMSAGSDAFLGTPHR